QHKTLRGILLLLQLMLWFLVLSDQQVEVTVREGSESVILPCNTTPDLPKNTTVEWTRSEVGLITVHEYSNRNDDFMTQDEVYRDRTKMNKDLLRTGDLSLSLKYPTERDSGGYICTIYRDKDILRQKVVLQVKGQCSRYRSVVNIVDTGQRLKGCFFSQNHFHPGPQLSWFSWFFLWFLDVFYLISGTISCQVSVSYYTTHNADG
uniref:Ig-like domain-containing protein n=1 Tax=Astatotilapia calliptera TaxID=8154 RepID=A0A3P8PES0_ASTCA